VAKCAQSVSLVNTPMSARPGSGGTMGAAPVASTTERAVSRRVLPSGCLISTVQGFDELRVALHHVHAQLRVALDAVMRLNGSHYLMHALHHGFEAELWVSGAQSIAGLHGAFGGPAWPSGSVPCWARNRS
jgi:hypothetical protein